MTSSPGLVAGLLDGLHDEAERLVGRRQRFGAKPPSSPTLVLWPGVVQRLLQRVEDLRRPCAGASAKLSGADRHDHEFLEVDRIVGVHAAVDDVHHRHRQHAAPRRRRHSGRAAGRARRPPPWRRPGVTPRMAFGAEARLVRRAVELDHRVRRSRPDPRRPCRTTRVDDLAVDGVDRLADTPLPQIAALVAVAQFDRLVGAGRRRPRAPRRGRSVPSSSITSTSTVGLPRLSRIWRAWTSTIAVMVQFLVAGSRPSSLSSGRRARQFARRARSRRPGEEPRASPVRPPSRARNRSEIKPCRIARATRSCPRAPTASSPAHPPPGAKAAARRCAIALSSATASLSANTADLRGQASDKARAFRRAGCKDRATSALETVSQFIGDAATHGRREDRQAHSWRLCPARAGCGVRLCRHAARQGCRRPVRRRPSLCEESPVQWRSRRQPPWWASPWSACSSPAAPRPRPPRPIPGRQGRLVPWQRGRGRTARNDRRSARPDRRGRARDAVPRRISVWKAMVEWRLKRSEGGLPLLIAALIVAQEPDGRAVRRLVFALAPVISAAGRCWWSCSSDWRCSACWCGSGLGSSTHSSRSSSLRKIRDHERRQHRESSGRPRQGAPRPATS